MRINMDLVIIVVLEFEKYCWKKGWVFRNLYFES